MNNPAISDSLQARSFGCVLNDPTFGLQFVTESVRALKIAIFSGSLASLQQGDDFSRGFEFLPGTDSEYRIHSFPRCQTGSSGLAVQRAIGEPPVHVANPIENDSPSAGDI